MATAGDVDQVGAAGQRGEGGGVEQLPGLGRQRQGVDDKFGLRQRRVQRPAAALPAGHRKAQRLQHPAAFTPHLAPAQHHHPRARRRHRQPAPLARRLLHLVARQPTHLVQCHQRHVLGDAQRLVGVDHPRHRHRRRQVGHQQFFNPRGHRADPAQRRQPPGQPGRKAPAQHHFHSRQRGRVERAAVGQQSELGRLRSDGGNQWRGHRRIGQQQDRGGGVHGPAVCGSAPRAPITAATPRPAAQQLTIPRPRREHGRQRASPA